MPVRRPAIGRLGVLVQGALWGALILQAALFAFQAALDIAYPYPLEYGEGIALDRVLALARGEPLYHPVGRPPYASWNFPPLYAWVCALGARYVGPGFAFGRAVSAAAIAITAYCIYLLTRRHIQANPQVGPRRWAAVAALLFLVSPALARWGVLMRVDSLGIALGLAGYTAAASGASPVLAGVLFGLALLCKQSLVAGLLAACFAFAAARRWRDLCLVLSAFALVAGGVLLWQHTATRGWLWWHLITCNTNPWRLGQLQWVAGPAIARHLTLLLLAASGILAEAVAGRRTTFAPETTPRTFANPGYYYLAGGAAVALLAGKVGSEVNYLLDLVAAACIVGTSAAVRLAALPRLRGGLDTGLAVVSALLCIQVAASLYRPALGDRASEAAAARSVVGALARATGPVIAEEPGFVPASGKPLWLQPFEFTQLAQAGKWDPEPLLAALRQGRFAVIALRFDPWSRTSRAPTGVWQGGRFTDEMVSAMRSAYRVSERIPGWVILRPAR